MERRIARQSSKWGFRDLGANRFWGWYIEPNITNIERPRKRVSLTFLPLKLSALSDEKSGLVLETQALTLNLMLIQKHVLPCLSFTSERPISSHLGTEAGIGLLGISAGPNFYFPAIKRRQLKFKSGLIHSFTLNPFDSGIKAFIPLGIHYQSKYKLVFSFDAGPQFLYDNNDVSPIFNLKIGKAF